MFKEELEERLRKLTDALAPLGAKLESFGDRVESLGDRVEAKLGSLRPGSRERDDDVELHLVTHPDGTVEFDEPRDVTHEDDGTTRTSVRFTDLPGNTIQEALRGLDHKLTPDQGLRVLQPDGTLLPATGRFAGKTLLVVHGTFSNSDNVLAGMERGDPDFLRWARQHYDQVLTFDYASLSTRTVANAMALRRVITAQVEGDVDLVCHSQGGLLARYWLELLEPNRLGSARVILVGAPLAGTSLASPANLRNALRILASAATVVGVGASVASGLSLLAACGGLAGILKKMVGKKTLASVLDAAVGLVPGVDSMSRASTNAELDELRRGTTGVPPGYFVISGDFEPPEGWTERSVKQLGKQAGVRAMDGVLDRVFPGTNDLIVDTPSHTELSDACDIGHGDPGRVFRFTGGEVHHRNYFSQKSTLAFIASRLQGG